MQRESTSHAVSAFVMAARHYRRFIETAAQLPLEERLLEAQRAVLALYVTGLQLPSVTPPAGIDADRWARGSVAWEAFGQFEHYAMKFDPYDGSSSVMGSLSDDLLDVAGDVLPSLELYELGGDAMDAAVWTWRFHFDIHWGQPSERSVRCTTLHDHNEK